MNFNYKNNLDIFTVEEEEYSDYSGSAEFANFVIDFDEDRELLGVEIIDASEALPLEKAELDRISNVNVWVEETEEYLKISVEIFVNGTKSVVSSNSPINPGLEA